MNSRILATCLSVLKLGLAAGWLSFIGPVRGSDLRPDERVIFFPSLGQQVGDAWELEIHGWVFEPGKRPTRTALLRHALGLSGHTLSAAEKAVFAERAQFFLEDNERGKRISIQLGGQTHLLETSVRNGHFTTRLRFARADWDRLGLSSSPANRRAQFQTVSQDKRVQPFSGLVHLVNETGVSVISDIDDTIKISQVRERRALVKNTFCRPFQAVPGMAAVYRSWTNGADLQFHYVSASPWQLYPALSEFVLSNGFPAGSFHMKLFRVKDETFFDLLASPVRYKLGVIEPLLKRFPKRRFLLVGDSGEKDPEVYGSVARKYPGQIAKILIREATGEPLNSTRYREAFEGLPRSVWQVFREPAEIQGIPE